MAWPDIATPDDVRQRITKKQVRSPFEAGYVQSMALHTRSRRKFSLSWEFMSSSDLSTLETYFENNIGSTFSWTHPISGTTYTVGFTENYIDSRNVFSDYYSVSVTLEEQ